jgi:hypothetical protein
VHLISGATRLLAAVLCAGLTIAAPASAQSPPDGSAFTTTDTVHFEHPDAAAGDRAYVFSLTPDRSDGWFTFGHERDETVDLGWLATKFDHLGSSTGQRVQQAWIRTATRRSASAARR